jgi:hypothetical protein
VSGRKKIANGTGDTHTQGTRSTVNNAATQEQTGTQRRPMSGPTVWNQASLRAEDYVIEVDAQQAAACLRIRDRLRHSLTRPRWRTGAAWCACGSQASRRA